MLVLRVLRWPRGDHEIPPPPSGPRALRTPGRQGRGQDEAGRPRSSKPSALREAARTQLQGHGTDAVALTLLALAALTGLALATDLAGPLGRGVSAGITALLGNGAFLVPLAFLAIAGAAALAPPDEDESAAPLRVGIGVVLIVLAAVGLLHVARRVRRTLSDPVDTLRDAGGYLGGVIGAPLIAGVGTAGAAIVLLALLALGGLLASGLSLARVGRARRGRRSRSCASGSAPRSRR